MAVATDSVCGHAPTWWPYSTTSETTISTSPTCSCVPLLICRTYEMSLRSCMLLTIIILLDFLDMLKKPLYMLPFSYMYQGPVINPPLMRPLLILTMGPLLHLGLSLLHAFMCNVILLMGNLTLKCPHDASSKIAQKNMDTTSRR